MPTKPERIMPEPRLNAAGDPFAPLRLADPARPFVIAQLGQSLDGRIATVSGESKYINGAPALDHLHQLRAEVDAVVVGAGTVAADDPLLTVRRVTGQNPARVVIDPSGRLCGDARWLERDGTPCISIRAKGTTPLQAAGCEEIELPLDNGAIAPRAIVDALFARGFRKLLIEGGAKTISAFIDADCIDRLHLLVAPLIIGSGRIGLDLAPVADLALARRPVTHLHPFENGEFLIDCDLRNDRRAEQET